ncbi:MAG TPA: GDP-L-fucose synthase [Rhodospirillales bacterium]|nr:GDP-L-fucose synthase [Rhodospirillales bacterium]
MAEEENQIYSLAGKQVWVNGHRGMVGSALVRRLESEDCKILKSTSDELDLRRQSDVEAWMEVQKPDAIFLCAATVGGILANETRPAEFIYDNMMIETNVIHGAWRTGVEKLLFMGSACIYPREAPQPMPEDCLLTGPLEPTNEWYAIAKIAGIKLCQAYRKQFGADFISAQPINLYGPGDNFDLVSSHVVPALIRKAHEAKAEGRDSMEIWGSGNPMREFLYVADIADALVFLMKRFSGDMQMNVGWGREISIRQLAETIGRIVGFEGKLVFDASKPDGTPRKLLDTTRLSGLGWKATTSLEEGLEKSYTWFLENVA